MNHDTRASYLYSSSFFVVVFFSSIPAGGALYIPMIRRAGSVSKRLSPFQIFLFPCAALVGAASAYNDEPAWVPVEGSPSESVVAALRALLAPIPPLLHHLETSLADAASSKNNSRAPIRTATESHVRNSSSAVIHLASVSDDGTVGDGGRSSNLSVEATRTVLAESAITFARAQQDNVAADEQWLPQKVCAFF